MAINKVSFGSRTLIDLTADTVTADKLAQGVVAHDRTGNQIIGTASIDIIGPEPEPKDINFYDYDGKRCYAYTLAEARSLSQLPLAPSHKGLVFQEWNWTLQEIKAMGRPVDIGANYITDDGATRLYIELQPEALSPYICLGIAGTVTVDWGDGTPANTLTGTSDHTLIKRQHVYSKAGKYVISIKVTAGNIAIRPDDYYGNILRSSAASYPDPSHDFRYLNSIQKIEFGNGIELKSDAFRSCSALKTISMPSNVFSRMDNYIFRDCFSLKCVVFPRSISSIWGNPFGGDDSLEIVALAGNTPDLDKSSFAYCDSLKRITLPKTMRKLYRYVFDDCDSLTSIIIPGEIENIQDAAFRGCYSMKYIDFTRCTTIPAFGIEVFDFTPPDMEIRVPKNNVAAWKAATNLSVYADKIVGV